MSTQLVRLAAAVLTSEKGRKTVGWVLTAILSPVILLVAFLCCVGSGTAEHNSAVVSAAFYGTELSESVPTEYRAQLTQMRGSFSHLDAAVAEVNSQAQPITPEEYQHLIHLRMENTGKVTGVFDLDFDKREFSAVHTIEGWKTWAMQDVSTAVYRATQKQLVSGDVMLQKLLECLNGKEITSAGHLSARNFSFGEEIIESDGKLNFYLQADFDVDAAFGTFVCTDQNDDWLNIYANYDIEKDRLCDTLGLNLCKGDGTEENWSYHLNAAEQEVLARKMEAFCQQQTGMSLHEYAQQLRESGSQTPEMQM